MLFFAGKGTMSTPGSTSGSPVSSPRGPLPRHMTRRARVERSPLIRHPSTLSTGSAPGSVHLEERDGNTSILSTENHQFIKDVSIGNRLGNGDY